MSRSIAGKIKINSFTDLVGGEETGISEIPIKDLYEFEGHPFRVLDDEKMDETVESIKTYGVLMPGIVRPRNEGGYEIISGHRRRRACEKAGLETMPVIIRNYSDDEATVVMVDSNIQREDILPSEKAKAYKMKYDAMKHQGAEGGNSLNNIGEAAGESGKTVWRYICLARLSDVLLEFVDDKKIPLRSGVELSYLKEKEQEWLEAVLKEKECIVSIAQAEKIRAYSEDKELNKTLIREILSGDKDKPRSFIIRSERIADYFPENTSADEIEETIISLLEKWKKGGD